MRENEREGRKVGMRKLKHDGERNTFLHRMRRRKRKGDTMPQGKLEYSVEKNERRKKCANKVPVLWLDGVEKILRAR